MPTDEQFIKPRVENWLDSLPPDSPLFTRVLQVFAEHEFRVDDFNNLVPVVITALFAESDQDTEKELSLRRQIGGVVRQAFIAETAFSSNLSAAGARKEVLPKAPVHVEVIPIQSVKDAELVLVMRLSRANTISELAEAFSTFFHFIDTADLNLDSRYRETLSRIENILLELSRAYVAKDEARVYTGVVHLRDDDSYSPRLAPDGHRIFQRVVSIIENGDEDHRGVIRNFDLLHRQFSARTQSQNDPGWGQVFARFASKSRLLPFHRSTVFLSPREGSELKVPVTGELITQGMREMLQFIIRAMVENQSFGGRELFNRILNSSTFGDFFPLLPVSIQQDLINTFTSGSLSLTEFIYPFISSNIYPADHYSNRLESFVKWFDDNEIVVSGRGEQDMADLRDRAEALIEINRLARASSKGFSLKSAKIKFGPLLSRLSDQMQTNLIRFLVNPTQVGGSFANMAVDGIIKRDRFMQNDYSEEEIIAELTSAANQRRPN